MSQQSFSFKMRVVHRYLGFFLAGIMAVYALSGIVLIFRDTDFLKNKTEVKKVIATNISKEELGKAIKIKKLKVDKEEGDTYFFKNGNYNKATGAVEYTKKELPFILGKMTHLHKAKSSEPLYFLNIFFGVALLFFVISSFWMFMPSSSIFKKGMYFTIGGILLTLLLLFI
jgi:hypothetical protein